MGHTETVQLGDRAYDICIGPDLLKGLGEACRKVIPGRRILLVSDTAVDLLYGAKASASLTAAGYEVVRPSRGQPLN